MFSPVFDVQISWKRQLICSSSYWQKWTIYTAALNSQTSSHLDRLSVMTTFDFQKLSGWAEIDLILHLNKRTDTGSGNWTLDVLDIAGPSGTNKQLPKPPPPPRPLLSSINLQKRENKLGILPCLISFPSFMAWKWNEILWLVWHWISNCVWVLVLCLCGCLYVVTRIRGRVSFGISPSLNLIE